MNIGNDRLVSIHSPFVKDINMYQGLGFAPTHDELVAGLEAKHIGVDGLLLAGVNDHERTCRGNCVRGELILVRLNPCTVGTAISDLAIDPQQITYGLDEESVRYGKSVRHATAFELMFYALTDWDLETQIVACGTTLQKPIDGEADPSGTTGEAFAYLSGMSYMRIGTAFPSQLNAPLQTLCVITPESY